jgi:hypothetical protein
LVIPPTPDQLQAASSGMRRTNSAQVGLDVRDGRRGNSGGQSR